MNKQAIEQLNKHLFIALSAIKAKRDKSLQHLAQFGEHIRIEDFDYWNQEITRCDEAAEFFGDLYTHTDKVFDLFADGKTAEQCRQHVFTALAALQAERCEHDRQLKRAQPEDTALLSDSILANDATRKLLRTLYMQSHKVADLLSGGSDDDQPNGEPVTRTTPTVKTVKKALSSLGWNLSFWWGLEAEEARAGYEEAYEELSGILRAIEEKDESDNGVSECLM